MSNVAEKDPVDLIAMREMAHRLDSVHNIPGMALQVRNMADELEEFRAAAIEFFSAEIAIDHKAMNAATARMHRLVPAGKP